MPLAGAWERSSRMSVARPLYREDIQVDEAEGAATRDQRQAVGRGCHGRGCLRRRASSGRGEAAWAGSWVDGRDADAEAGTLGVQRRAGKQQLRSSSARLTNCARLHLPNRRRGMFAELRSADGEGARGGGGRRLCARRADSEKRRSGPDLAAGNLLEKAHPLPSAHRLRNPYQTRLHARLRDVSSASPNALSRGPDQSRGAAADRACEPGSWRPPSWAHGLTAHARVSTHFPSLLRAEEENTAAGYWPGWCCN